MTLLAEDSVVQIPRWKEMAWLRHGFSTRNGGVSTVYRGSGLEDAGGDLNTGWTAADDPANVAENRCRLIASVGGGDAALVTVRQVHSAKSLAVLEDFSGFFNEEGRAAMEADGLMTKVPGVLLGIQTADCVPVLVADVRLRVVAGFHAGWRGTVAGIVERGIAQLSAEYGSRPEDLVAAVGPSIGACCYSVGDEVREAFASGFSYASDLFESRGDGLFLDLWEANRRQLIAAGVPESRISVVRECSGCAGLPERRKYFSHRCENGFTGRMMSVIGLVRGETMLD
jgi:YfiH family protein